MNDFFTPHNGFLRRLKRAIFPLALLFLFCITAAFSACRKSVDYFDYVSELRSNIFLAESDGFSLRIFATVKESPYSSDGVPRETSSRLEAYLVAPEGDKECKLSFSLGDKTHGGEMSYDNVKGEYYYYCTLDISQADKISCALVYGETELALEAKSVRTESTLAPREILQKLQISESELFSSMTDKYGFAGEIYLRLIYEDNPYYYVGVIDRQGKINAFLMNAETGKILAKRQS